MAGPRFSIITVSYNDVWALQKTIRSIFQQGFEDFEFILVDGGSGDGSEALIAFWEAQGLITRSISEPDNGVYDAMNKGVSLSRGEFVCFMNASDVFADDGVLERIDAALSANPDLDGVMGWGELNGDYWASWTSHPAFKMASLGFCHQALFLRRSLLVEIPFDDRVGRTDSDTQQLGRALEAGAQLELLPEVLAKRGGEPGISADLTKTAVSIKETLLSEYPEVLLTDAELLLGFRRRCEGGDAVLALLEGARGAAFRAHAARMVLDTLFQPQSTKLDENMRLRLFEACAAELQDRRGRADIERLIAVQNRKAALLREVKESESALYAKLAQFEKEEASRIEKLYASGDLGPSTSAKPDSSIVVAMTSFPARLKSVSFVANSLFEQTLPPKEIHLFLGRDEIPKASYLPRRLRALEDRGLVFHFVDRTFHQYDKYMHGFEMNADRPYVIVDDDVIYPPTSLERLVAAHRKFPDAVIGNRCHEIAADTDGVLAPYSEWTREVQTSLPSHRLLATGAGGVLYPPGFMTKDMVASIDLLLANAPYADDLWLKACAIARDIPVFATELSRQGDWYHRYTPSMMEGTLMNLNVQRGLNDIQIERCARWLDEVRPGWRAMLAQSEVVS